MRHVSFLSIIIAMMLAIVPTALFAADAEFTFDFFNPSDKSLEYLGMIFGPVGNNFQTADANVGLSRLMGLFNMAVLSLGAIVVSYTIVLSTINTAQEGEVMGRKISAVWIPLRSCIGVAFLLPTASGYSVLQVIMMDIVVYGVNAADQVWNAVLDQMYSPGGLGGNKVDSGTTIKVATSLYYGALCQKMLNSQPACQSALNLTGGRTIEPYVGNVGAFSGLMIGIKGDTNNKNYMICGGAFANITKPELVTASNWAAANTKGFEDAMAILSLAADETIAGSEPSNPSFISDASKAIKNAIGNAPSQPKKSRDKDLTKQDGWIFAGSYYSTMTHMNASSSYPAPIGLPYNLEKVGKDCQTAFLPAVANSTTYIAKAYSSSSSRDALSIPDVSTDSRTAGFVDAIAAPLREAVEDFNETLTTNDPNDPVASVANVGSTILSVAQTIWFAVMAAAVLAMIFGCIMSGTSPICWLLGAIISVLVPLLNIIIALLWAVGAMLGLYVPMIPYIVFTFTALGWMILVIETMVAAPVVCLGLVSPSEGHLGKAAPAVLLITNVFLRPTLMVIGLVVAATLVKAVIQMLNFGFAATINATVSGLGVFGLLALLCLYGGTALALIHECFTIIYILPDKITRWIGGQMEQPTVDVKKRLEGAKGHVAKGAEIGGKAMQASVTEVKKTLKVKEGMDQLSM